MAEDEANVGMLPMVATPERSEVMARYFTMTLKDTDRIAPAKVEAFAAVAISLGLHPLAGELMIIEGRLYVTVDGRRRLAMRNPDFAAIHPSIVTDEATRVAMGATRKGDVLAMCKLYRKSTPIPSIQYGLVREAERWPSRDKSGPKSGGGMWTSAGEQTKLGLTDDQVEAAKAMHDPDSLFDLADDPAAKVRPVLTQPAMMAMKRAEARALSLMASVALPTYDPEVGAALDPDIANGNGYPIVEGEIVETPEPVAEPAPVTPAPDPIVELESGLVTDPGLGVEDEPPAEPDPDPMTREAPATAARPPVSTKAPPRKAEPVTEPVGGGLVRAPETPEKVVRYAIENLHYRNIAAVLAALGVSASQEITDCSKAWATLVKLAPAGTPA